MNTDKWNTRISVVANIGVVIGLFLLIFEIRQNTEMIRAQICSISAKADIWTTSSATIGYEIRLRQCLSFGLQRKY